MPLWYINLVVYSVHLSMRVPPRTPSTAELLSIVAEVSALTRLLTTPPHSNIRDHTFNCHSPITLEYFTILNSCKSETDLHILESQYIYKTNPGLNSSQSAHPLNIVNKRYLCLFYNYYSPFSFHSNIFSQPISCFPTLELLRCVLSCFLIHFISFSLVF